MAWKQGAIIDGILCNTLRPVLWRSPGILRYHLARASVSELGEWTVLEMPSPRAAGLPHPMRICCCREPPSSLCIWPIFVWHWIQLSGWSLFIIFTVFTHSFNRQALCIHSGPGTLGKWWEKNLPSHVRRQMYKKCLTDIANCHFGTY